MSHVITQLRSLGVREGAVLLVHTSFRGIGPLEGGADGLIDALMASLGPQGTLVMPTMTDGETVFDPRATPTPQMGITAERFWRRAHVLRSGHPGGSFAAVGPHAERICAPQPLTPPHGPDSPPGRVHELEGQILLLGVDHSESTTLHVAEAIATVPYSVSHPCVVEEGGVVREVMIAETDHCCRGFCIMNRWLEERGLQRTGPVGHGMARLADARAIVSLAVEKLRRDPLVFLCATERRCEECDQARASIVR